MEAVLKPGMWLINVNFSVNTFVQNAGPTPNQRRMSIQSQYSFY